MDISDRSATDRKHILSRNGLCAFNFVMGFVVVIGPVDYVDN